MGPWTTAPNADPMSRNPTTLFTPEHAETTLSGNDCPWWTTTNSVPSGEVTDFATGTHLDDLADAAQRRGGEGVEDPQQHRRVRVGPAQEQVADGELLAPQDPHPEDDGDRAGHEDRQRQEVDPPHPEHRRQLARQEQVGGQRAAHQRQADDVVDLAVVDGRLGPQPDGPARRPGRGRWRARGSHRRVASRDRRSGSASTASSCRPRPPRPRAQSSGPWSGPAPELRATAAAPRCFHRPALERHVSYADRVEPDDLGHPKRPWT